MHTLYSLQYLYSRNYSQPNQRSTSMFITQSLLMANVNSEGLDNSTWLGYNLESPFLLPSHSFSQPFDNNFYHGPSTLTYHRPSEREGYDSLDISPMQSKSRDRTGDLSTCVPGYIGHDSFPSYGQALCSTEPPLYRKVEQEYTEEIPENSELHISQNHRMLSFNQVSEANTILDSDGNVHRIGLTARIQGMFRLSEVSCVNQHGLLVQPELTCYRRNLFQIFGTATIPRGPLFIITERGQRIPALSIEVQISASETVDGLPVKLIVIPGKPPSLNPPEGGQENEPAPIQLLPFEEGNPEANNELAVCPISYRRLQFRVATANNGRRRELQQHFTLHLNVVAQLSNGATKSICETATVPIVVRGRNPRNFQVRKNNTLSGPSSCRGALSDSDLTAKIRSCANSVSAPTGKLFEVEQGGLEMPQSPYIFDPNQHLPSSPSLLHTSMYPSYLGIPHSEDGMDPNMQNYSSTSTGLYYLQGNQMDSFHSHSQSPPVTASGPQHTFNQHIFQPSPISPHFLPVKFIDSNQSPPSPYHVTPPELEPLLNDPCFDFGGQISPAFPVSEEALSQERPEYLHTSHLTEAWTPRPQATSVYEEAVPGMAPNLQNYDFRSEEYQRGDPLTQEDNVWDSM